MEDPSGVWAGLGGLALIFLCLLCLLIPFIIALSLIYPFAFRGIILRDLGVMDSIRHGWKTLREHLGEIILLCLAFFLIGIIIVILTAAIMVPVPAGGRALSRPDGNRRHGVAGHPGRAGYRHRAAHIRPRLGHQHGVAIVDLYRGLSGVDGEGCNDLAGEQG
jgi:hypothetical protein